MKKINFKVISFIGAIVLFYAVNNFVWLSLNKLPSGEDEYVHLVTSLSYYIHLFKPEFKKLIELYKHPYWPPLYYLTGAIFSFIFSPEYKWMVLVTNLFYVFLLLSGIYFLARDLFSRLNGVFSVYLIAFSPIIFGFSRIFMLEIALSALVAWAIHIILLFDKLHRKRRYWYLFFILVFGMLVKWSFIIFILAALLRTLYKKCQKKLILVLIFSSLLLIISWYSAQRFLTFFQKAMVYILRSQGELTFYNYFKEILFYFKFMAVHYCSIILFLFYTFSLIYLFSKRIKYKITLLLTILLPLLFFSFLKPHNERHLIPILVSLSLIGGNFLEYLWHKKLKLIVIIMFTALFLHYFTSSYFPISTYSFLGYRPIYRRVFDRECTMICTSPYLRDYKYNEINNAIDEYNSKKRFHLPVRYAIFSNNKIVFSDFSLLYYDLIRKLTKNIQNINHFFLPADSPREANYIITVSETKSWPDEKISSPYFPRRFDNILYFQNDLKWLFNSYDKYESVGKIRLPGNKIANIYAQKLEILKSASFKVLIDYKDIFIVPEESDEKFRINLTIKEDYFTDISSANGVTDIERIESDYIRGYFYWYSFPEHKLYWEIRTEQNRLYFKSWLPDFMEKRIIVKVDFGQEKEKRQDLISGADFYKCLTEENPSLLPLAVYEDNIFIAIGNLRDTGNQMQLALGNKRERYLRLEEDNYIDIQVEFFKNKMELVDYFLSFKSAQIFKNGPITVYFSNTGSVKIFYKDTEITTSAGLYNELDIKGKSYNTATMASRITKHSPNSGQIIYEWGDISDAIEWYIDVKEDRIIWQIRKKDEGSMKAGWMFPKEYKIFYNLKEVLTPNSLNYIIDLPLAVAYSEGVGYIFHCLKGDEQIAYRRSKDNQIFYCAKEDIEGAEWAFIIEIIFKENNEEIEEFIKQNKGGRKISGWRVAKTENLLVKKGAFLVEFSEFAKAVKVYYKNKEVTYRDGLYTEIASNNERFRTTHGKWKKIKVDGKDMFICSWPGFDGFVRWELKIVDNKISWDVSAEGNIDYIESGMIFSSDFTTWQDAKNILNLNEIENWGTEFLYSAIYSNKGGFIFHVLGGASENISLYQERDFYSICYYEKDEQRLKDRISLSFEIIFFDDVKNIKNYLKLLSNQNET